LKKSKLSREESVDAHTSTEKGIVIRYQIAAVPIARGLTGVPAFCADESATLFHERTVVQLCVFLRGCRCSDDSKSFHELTDDSTMTSNSDDLKVMSRPKRRWNDSVDFLLKRSS